MDKKEIARIANIWIPDSQRQAVNVGLRGEEGKWFSDKLKEIAEVVTNMPVTFKNRGADPMAYIRYFAGEREWYITEKDISGDEPGEDHYQAYGYVRGWENEFGYISIPELRGLNVEMDFHFTPTRISELPSK